VGLRPILDGLAERGGRKLDHVVGPLGSNPTGSAPAGPVRRSAFGGPGLPPPANIGGPAKKKAQPPDDGWALIVEAAGVEPASANGSNVASTCVGPCCFRSRIRPGHGRTGLAVLLVSSPAGQRHRKTSPICRRLGARYGLADPETGYKLRIYLMQPAPGYRWRL
jgi:hypothetical protein